MFPSNHCQYKTIKIDSSNNLGIGIRAEAFNRDYGFDFPIFPKGKEYPIVASVNLTSEAYKMGMRAGHKIISLNGYSFFQKDISTILSDFEYEKRSCKFLTLLLSD